MEAKKELEKKLVDLKENEAWLVKKEKDFKEGNQLTINAQFLSIAKKLQEVRAEIKEVEEQISNITE